MTLWQHILTARSRIWRENALRSILSSELSINQLTLLAKHQDSCCLTLWLYHSVNNPVITLWLSLQRLDLGLLHPVNWFGSVQLSFEPVGSWLSAGERPPCSSWGSLWELFPRFWGQLSLSDLWGRRNTLELWVVHAGGNPSTCGCWGWAFPTFWNTALRIVMYTHSAFTGNLSVCKFFGSLYSHFYSATNMAVMSVILQL